MTIPFASRLSDAKVMSTRSLLILTRQLDFLLLTILLPVLLMVMFVYVFGSAMDVGSSYNNYVVPGVLLLCAGYGAAGTAVMVANDKHNGVIERYKSMPVFAPSVLIGHVVASMASNSLSTALVVGAAFITGFRPSASLRDWLLATGLMLLFIFALSWVATALGLHVRNAEAASGATFFVLFLPYLSSAFVPVEGLPVGLRFIATHQPFTPLTETLRSLLLDTPMNNHGWIALSWLIGMLVFGYIVSVRKFSRPVS